MRFEGITRNVRINFKTKPPSLSTLNILFAIQRFNSFRHLRIQWKLGRFNFIPHLETRKQSDLIRTNVQPFTQTVPVVAGDADEVAHGHRHFAAPTCFMGQHGDDVVCVLSAVIVDVVQRTETGGRIRIVVLHYLVRHSTHLIQTKKRLLHRNAGVYLQQTCDENVHTRKSLIDNM